MDLHEDQSIAIAAVGSVRAAGAARQPRVSSGSWTEEQSRGNLVLVAGFS